MLEAAPVLALAPAKKRASRNSRRHGLAATMVSRSENAKRIERLARKIAGDGADAIVLECARAAAQAEFDLAQVRRAKVALIASEIAKAREGVELVSEIEAEDSMPSTEPDRTAEAVRRALPELMKLDRYERRASRRRKSLQVIWKVFNR